MNHSTDELLNRIGLSIAEIRMDILDVKRELSDINTRLDALIASTSSTRQVVDDVGETICDLKLSTDKMSAHVDFVNTMYDHVRRPLSAVLGRTLSPQPSSSITFRHSGE